MSTNILKKLVERYAPETVINELDRIEKAHAKEREARFERECREKHLLESLYPGLKLGNAKPPVPPTEPDSEPIACLS